MRDGRSLLLIFVLAAAPAGAQQATFESAVPYAAQGGTLGLVAGDFNGDGKIDIATANAAANTVTLQLGSGTGALNASTTLPPAPVDCQANSLATGDFNKDGHLDILAICASLQAMAVFPGKGDGTFGSAIRTNLPFYPSAGDYIFDNSVPPAIADFDGDGQLDLALVNSDPANSNGVTIFKGKGDGTFLSGTYLPLATSVLSVAAADVNGDGKPDLLFIYGSHSGAGQSLGVALGQGNGTFAASHSYPVTDGYDFVVGDVTGDGIPDVVTYDGYLYPAVQVFAGDGQGNFTNTFSYTEATDSSSSGIQGSNFFLALADVRGIGKPDLVEITVSFQAATASFALAIFPNNGGGSFGKPYTLSIPSNIFVTSFITPDLNGDGLPDLVLSDVPANAQIDPYDSFPQIVASLPAGGVDVLLNSTTRGELTFSNANGASFATGAVAADSIVSAFGTGFPPQVAVNVTDSAGTTRAAQLFYNSATQINYAIPPQTATGDATITITGGSQTFTATLPIVTVAPGVFSANGLAAGSFDTYQNNAKIRSTNLVTQTSSGQLIPTPIDLGSGSEQVYLILYGTGIRNHKNPVTAQIGSTSLPTIYAGAQGTFVSEDQINVLLPQSLKGAGVVNVTLNVDGQTTNPVQIQIQ